MIKTNKQWEIPRSISFPILSLILFAYFFAASASAPLFATLQHLWHFSAASLTLAFGIYALSLLLALIFLGSLSDYVGRKPVIFVGLFIQTLGMILFLFAEDIQGLIIARIIQGLATGIATGALAAAVVEFAPEGKKKLGSMISSISPLAGLAMGALVSGVAIRLVQLHHVSILSDDVVELLRQ